MWHYESVTSFFFSSNYFSLFLILRTLCDSGHVARFGRHIPTSISKLHRARSSQWDNVCLQPCQWCSKLCKFQSFNQNRKTTMEIRWVYICLTLFKARLHYISRVNLWKYITCSFLWWNFFFKLIGLFGSFWFFLSPLFEAKIQPEYESDTLLLFFSKQTLIFFAVNNFRYITSDCGAVSIIHEKQGYAKTAEDAIADVFRAGIMTLFFFLYPSSSYIHTFLSFVYMIIIGVLSRCNHNVHEVII